MLGVVGGGSAQEKLLQAKAVAGPASEARMPANAIDVTSGCAMMEIERATFRLILVLKQGDPSGRTGYGEPPREPPRVVRRLK
jgi:hypothetical protein